MWSDDERQERIKEASTRAAFVAAAVIGTVSHCNNAFDSATDAVAALGRSMQAFQTELETEDGSDIDDDPMFSRFCETLRRN